MPDAISYATIGGQGYIFTANEGDSREFGSVIDANRISSSTFANLDPVAFPDAAILKNNKFLGRLSALKYSGDTDGDGDYDLLTTPYEDNGNSEYKFLYQQYHLELHF